MKSTQTEINNAITKIEEGLSELKRLYNAYNTDIKEMFKIADYAKLLDNLDFTKSITE